MPHAPFGRTGGKKNLKKRLIAMFPTEYNTFVEPFVGAGNIFYSTPKVDNEIINDIDEDMYIIHKGLQDNSQDIQDNLPRHLTSEEFKIRKHKKDAISTLYKYKASFMSNGQDFNSKECNTIALNFLQFGERLEGVTILNSDYLPLIKQYDSTTTFFYLDPPYESAHKNKDYIHTGVTPQNIYDSLQGIKGKFMLSYNSSDNIKEIFSKYKITSVSTLYSKTPATVISRKVDELVITNY